VIGWLNNPAGPATNDGITFTAAVKQGLADTGYVVGRNVTIESRAAGIDRLPALATDLVRRQVTVIVAVGIRAAQAAKAATQTIPVVFGIIGDPVEVGLVASLNRPSGNLTGFTNAGIDLNGKRVELLHQLVPAADPIAVLARDAGALPLAVTKAMQSAARVLGVRLLVLYASTGSEVAAAFANLVEQRTGALVIAPGTFFPGALDQIISLAGRYAVPTLFVNRAGVVSGGLASYGPTTIELARQMGIYTGRILKGEKPADLPIVQPTKFELVINLKTAKALGLTIPETMLATADEVIQ
jgi:putative ABC transport system substrate-binding protein